jgi:hypothetical protein
MISTDFGGINNMKTEFYVECDGRQVNLQDLEDTAKSTWRNEGKKMKDLRTLQIYYKPQEQRYYLVFNGESKGDSYIV